MPFIPSIWAVAAARSPSSSRLRLARRMIEPMTNEVVAASRTDRLTPTKLSPGVWANTAMIEPGAAGARRPAPKIGQGEDADHAAGDGRQEVRIGFISTYGK